MTRTGFLLAFLFVSVLIGGLVAFAPLSFLMRQSGVASQGLGWLQARGSVWHGQVTGLYWKGDPLGSVSLDADLMRALRGGASHTAQWSGPAGQGRALIILSGGGVSAEDVSVSLPLSDGLGIDPMIARLRASVRLTDGRVAYRGGACTQASGRVTSDLAQQAAAMFERSWPLLTGPLTCRDGVLYADLTGVADDGTDISLSANPETGLRIDIVTEDADARVALLSAGFLPEGDSLTYAYTVQTQGKQP